MKHLNNIAKIVVVAIVITIFIMVVTSCAYVAGDGNAIVNIKPEVSIKDAIKVDATKDKK